MKTNYPLFLVFYIYRETIQNQQIIQPFIDSVNKVLEEKNANTIAFFLPTDEEERIECINPITISETDMAPINKIVEDIKKSFSIGDTEPDTNVASKDCECGRDASGVCKC